ncbi:MAG: FAD-binding oxidoreductase [Calditrichaeota bacterium]|nr:MAG: FAD-binding oxidoreductase [Calditrichota bacterium]
MQDAPNYESWGRFPKVSHTDCFFPRNPPEIQSLLEKTEHTVLPRGAGRSYGDVCLNSGGALIATRFLNKYIAFDDEKGLLRCESGVTIAEIISSFLPNGWFLPVVPGTKFVTIGGAIANDIHGKNHHKYGNFSRCVEKIGLLNSSGKVTICSRNENSDLFHASIGGLGLTGFILWAEIKMRRLVSPRIVAEAIQMHNIDDFWSLSQESNHDFEYTVAWIDTTRRTKNMGRGIFYRGNHETIEHKNLLRHLPKRRSISVPFDMPEFVLNFRSIQLFNELYQKKESRTNRPQKVFYENFFFPLDAVHHWNRMYGKRGLIQWQCVIPPTQQHKAMNQILNTICNSKVGSFLTILKEFGEMKSEGLLSFPEQGTTLALDFPNTGQAVHQLCSRLHELVMRFGGKIYPAKDALMTTENFLQFYPNFQEFKQYIDPKFSSSFYRRITQS